MSDFEIAIRNRFGERTATILNPSVATYARGLGVVGSCSVTIPLTSSYDPANPVMDPGFNPGLFEIDGRLEFWREVDKGRNVLDTETSFFIRWRRWVREDDGGVAFQVGGPSAVELLTTRINAFNKTGLIALKQGTVHGGTVKGRADDEMKRVVRNNFKTSTAARNLADTDFIVDTDFTLGPSVGPLDVARLNILQALQNVHGLTQSKTNITYFDVVRHTDRAFAFRTYTGQRGIDRGSTSGSPLVFSKDNGNLVQETVTENYEGEITFAYAGGQGKDKKRIVGLDEDPDRSARSPIGRREGWLDARSNVNQNILNNLAKGTVTRGEPKLTLTGTLLSTDAVKYGRDWSFGDRVVASAFGVEMDVVVSAISVTRDSSGEKIDAKVERVISV